MKRILTIVTVLLVAGSAYAGPPAVGVYLSNDLGGTMLPGLFSESWVNPAASHGQVGNTLNAMSWDGVILGSEWKVWCPSIVIPPVLVYDNRDPNGTGEVAYNTQYGGGLFWMSKNGPWGDGIADYTGVVQTFVVTTTYMYVFGDILGIRGDVTMTAAFDGYDNCMEYTINNTAFVGTTDLMPVAPGYPPFLDTNCGATATRGGWGTVTEIALRILGSCTVGTQDTTWGAVKSLYK